MVKLISSRKEQRNNCLLTGRRNRQNVQANAFGEAGFVQEPIAFSFFQSLRNSFFCDGLQIKVHQYLLLVAAAEDPKQFRYWIEESVHHALLQRNDGIISDCNALGTDLGATLCDVA